MRLITTGPLGVLCALPSVEATVHGVSAKRFLSGREVSNANGWGETSITVYYLNGNRTTRQHALEVLRSNIAEGEQTVISGSMQFTCRAKEAS